LCRGATAAGLLALALAGGCLHHGAREETPMTTTADHDAVKTMLLETDPSELAWDGSPSHARLVAGNARASLEAIAHDPGEAADARFRAFEALVAFGAAPTEDALGPYLAALGTAQGHDVYGFPGSVPRGAGARIVAHGPRAIPGLVALADDTTPLVYDGSEEPTLAALRSYRVKDLVGVWLGALTATPIDVEADDPAARDRDIARVVDAARRLE